MLILILPSLAHSIVAEQTIAADGPMVRPSSKSGRSDAPHDAITVGLTTKDMSPVLPSSPRHPGSTHSSHLALLPLQHSTVQQTSTSGASLPSLASSDPASWSTWSFPLTRPPKASGIHAVTKKRTSASLQSKTGTVGPRRASSRVNWETVVVDRGISGIPTPNPWKVSNEGTEYGPTRREGLERKRHLPNALNHCNITSTVSSADQKGFQLQPVPPCKRRRYHDRPSPPLDTEHVAGNGFAREEVLVEHSRSCQAQPAHPSQHTSQLKSITDTPPTAALRNGELLASDIASHSVSSGPSERSIASYAASRSPSQRTHARTSQYKCSEHVVSQAVRDNLFNVAGAKGTALLQMRCPSFFATQARSAAGPASQSASITATPRGRQQLPASHGQAPRKRQPVVQAPNATQFSRLLPRLRRAQSVPNMRARSSMESLDQPVIHRLMLPPHLVHFLASVQRPAAAASDTQSTFSGGNSPSALPIMIAPATGTNIGEVGLQQSRSRKAGRQHVYVPPLHPPITRHTLRELDLAEILKNPQLRHDVVFDANVQFRPNFDGERGKKKKEACEKYWTAVSREIELGCICTSFEGQRLLPCTCGGAAAPSGPQRSPIAMTRDSKSGPGSCSKWPADRSPPSRVPVLVQELRAICLSILPGGNGAAYSPTLSRSPLASTMAGGGPPLVSHSGGGLISADHSVLASTLDPVFISQQLAHGVLDVPDLVSFLASVLQLHCAPMRDEMIDEMVQETKRGRVGKGLRMCFEVLELMKLDIANHQLRSARPYLVETAVEFEARWFRDQIVGNKLALDRTTAWFGASWRNLASESAAAESRPSRTARISKAYNDGFLNLVFDPPGTDSDGLTLHSRTAGGAPLSSSSLNHSYSAAYPETFQFDAFRLMTFHNDAIDLTIVYMLLMLFRQLSCSPAIAGVAPLPSTACESAKVSKIAARLAGMQLESVKNEVWCLLNEANTAIARSEINGAQDLEAAFTLSGSGSGGKVKLNDSRWRSAMKDAVLQVAARAGAVWDEAAGLAPSTSVRAPSTQTMAMLESWLQTNLVPQSALMKLCLSRLRGVLGSLIAQRVGGNVLGIASPSTLTPSSSTKSNDVVSERKRGAEDGPTLSAKRQKGDEAVPESGTSVDTLPALRASAPELCLPNREPRDSPSSDRPPMKVEELETEQLVDPVRSCANSSEQEEWELCLNKAGLEPLRSEVQVLGARMFQVAVVNLKTFRVLYERLAV